MIFRKKNKGLQCLHCFHCKFTCIFILFIDTRNFTRNYVIIFIPAWLLHCTSFNAKKKCSTISAMPEVARKTSAILSIHILGYNYFPLRSDVENKNNTNLNCTSINNNFDSQLNPIGNQIRTQFHYHITANSSLYRLKSTITSGSISSFLFAILSSCRKPSVLLNKLGYVPVFRTYIIRHSVIHH